MIIMGIKANVVNIIKIYNITEEKKI